MLHTPVKNTFKLYILTENEFQMFTILDIEFFLCYAREWDVAQR